MRFTTVLGGNSKLRAEKGINLPDSTLDLPGLTAQDSEDLHAVLGLEPDIIASEEEAWRVDRAAVPSTFTVALSYRPRSSARSVLCAAPT